MSGQPEGSKGSENENDLAVCPGCGLAQDAWPEDRAEGFVSETGERYCCELCAHGESCDCASAQAA